MVNIDRHFIEIGFMDQLASMDTPIHRIDPRAKLLTTMIFVAMVVSFNKYEISALLPFFLYPITLIALGDIPPLYLLRRILLAAPFAIMIGMFNPLLDRDILITIGSLNISGGWLSFLSILVRFTLTVGAAIILLSTSGIHGVCVALEKLGTPQAFTIQILFLYRYLFVLVAEGLRMVRARALRSFGKHGMGIRVYSNMLGHLLIRSLDRAQRIHSAMCCRGFNGSMHATKPLKLSPTDIAFVCGWTVIFIIMRTYNISQLLGSLITEISS